jgi:hypothetical protein
MSKAELVPHNHEALAPVLNVTPTSVSEVMQLASVFAASGLFPGVKDQAQAAVKILAGLELGMPPVAAMNNLDIIAVKDRPPRLRPNADAQAHLARRAGYEYRIVEHSATRCVLEWSRSGEVLGQSEFTMDEARTANLVKDFGGYKSWPKNMMLSRAITQGIKSYCRWILAAPMAGMEVVTQDEVEAGPLTDDTRKRLFAVTPRGFNRDERLQVVSDIVGREITSYKDLTEGEARFAADTLEAQGDPDIDPMEALEAEDEFQPFAATPDQPGVTYSDEAQRIAQGSAGGSAPESTGSQSPVCPAGITPAEQHTQGSAVSADGPRAGTLEGPDAAPAEQSSGAAREGDRSSLGLSAAPDQLPMKVETRIERAQRQAAATRAKFQGPAESPHPGRVPALAEAGPSAPMGPAVGSEAGEGEGGRVVSEGGDANSGDPSPARDIVEHPPSMPLHMLPPEDAYDLLRLAKDDQSVANSTVEGFLKAHGVSDLDDPTLLAKFRKLVLRK